MLVVWVYNVYIQQRVEGKGTLFFFVHHQGIERKITEHIAFCFYIYVFVSKRLSKAKQNYYALCWQVLGIYTELTTPTRRCLS